MSKELNVKQIEKILIKSLKKIIKKPSKQQLDRCKQRAKAVYDTSCERSSKEVLSLIESEAQEIAWEE